MTKELEKIKRALGMGIGTHGEPCSAGETCQAITEFREALAGVERLEAERQSDTRLSIATEALERISRMVCFTVVANEPRKVGCKCFSCAARSALSQIRVLESPRTVEAIDAAIESTKESA